RRTTDQPRNVPGQRVQYLAGGVASGDAPWVGREARQVAVPSRWQLAALHLFDLGSELGELRAVGGKKFMPFAPCFGTAGADPGIEMLSHPVGDKELRLLRPAVGAFREPDLFLAQGLAVSGSGIDLVR